jgi:hypothetical protein
MKGKPPSGRGIPLQQLGTEIESESFHLLQKQVDRCAKIGAIMLVSSLRKFTI